MSDRYPWLQRLAKWRLVLTGWQLGTRSSEDPEAQAVRHHREGTLLQRAELTALTGILIDKGICTRQELQEAVDLEAKYLCEAMERKFPGFRATDDGMSLDPKVAAETTKGWLP